MPGKFLIAKLLPSALALVAATGLFTSNAEAICRSCSAAYYMFTLSGPEKVIKFEDFSARRCCGWWEPNTCRGRARNAAHNCMSMHWETRFSSVRPSECTADNGVHNYDTDRLYIGMRAAVCAETGLTSPTFLIKRVSTGGTRCSRSVVLADGYTFWCPDYSQLGSEESGKERSVDALPYEVIPIDEALAEIAAVEAQVESELHEEGEQSQFEQEYIEQ